ncbi:MAG: HU family DNA-binding protein [Elusimicrobiaceae bacterium]|nr:HU family DNA-binding protein [Elusimicrobiaceae bacterium]
MNKDDVIRHLTRKVLDKKLAKTAVDSVFEIMKHGLKRDGKVVISNFGSFHLKTARPVTRHNPKTREKVQVPAKQKVRFKPSENILKK